MDNSNALRRFQQDGIELIINTQTGESFATISGYARIVDISQQAISKRVNLLTPTTELGANNTQSLAQQGKSPATNPLIIENVEVPTTQGIRRCTLITEDLIAEWIVKDNPDMAAKLLKVGVRVFLHRLAGYQVTSTATQPDTPKDRVTLACEMLDMIFAGVHIKPELIAGLKLNITQRHFPAIKGDLEEGRQLLIGSTANDAQALNPTQLGKRVGLSAKAINRLLIEQGFQKVNSDRTSKKDPTYLPTEKGSEFSTFTLASGKEEDKTTYQQLRWFESILAALNLS